MLFSHDLKFHQMLRELNMLRTTAITAPVKKLDAANVGVNQNRVCKWMEQMKIRQLGGGFFSRVFEHPQDPTKVIKWGPLSDGWLVYAAWAEAQRGTSNPHLPVIHSIRRYEKHGIYMAVMERLEATVMQAKREAMDEMRYQDADVFLGFHMVSAMLSNGSRYVCPGDWQHFLDKLKATHALTRTLDRLHTFSTRHGLGRDLHDENAMLRRRPDGGFDLVITDPFSFNNAQDKGAAIRAARHATAVAVAA